MLAMCIRNNTCNNITIISYSRKSIRVIISNVKIRIEQLSGSTSQQEGWGRGNFSFGNYTGKQELGGIRVHFEVRTSSADLGLEQSVVVLRTVCWWPTFDPLFFSGLEAQFGDQDNRVVLIAPNI